jgi:hypothetical protein
MPPLGWKEVDPGFLSLDPMKQLEALTSLARTAEEPWLGVVIPTPEDDLVELNLALVGNRRFSRNASASIRDVILGLVNTYDEAAVKRILQLQQLRGNPPEVWTLAESLVAVFVPVPLLQPAKNGIGEAFLGSTPPFEEEACEDFPEE